MICLAAVSWRNALHFEFAVQCLRKTHCPEFLNWSNIQMEYFLKWCVSLQYFEWWWACLFCCTKVTFVAQTAFHMPFWTAFEQKQSNIRHILSISNLFARLLVFLKFGITFISSSWILVGWETLSSEGWYYIANHDKEQVTFLILLLRMHLC